MNVRAMVMAAGAGTRLRPLTDLVPKPMVPIANRPVLEYTIENLRRHKIIDIVFNLHNHPELIQNHFGDGSKWGVHLSYSYERTLLGTAGGVKKAEEFLKGGTFLVMSGDGLTDINLSALLEFHRSKKSFATMALKNVDSRFDYGVTLTHSNGRIRQFVEKPRWSDIFSDQVNTGIYVFEPDVFRRIPKGKVVDFGHEVWPRLLADKKRLFGFLTKAYWCDVGNLSEYRKAQRDLLDRKTIFSLPGRQVRPGVWIDEDVQLSPGVRLEAPCLIGRGARLGKGCRIGAYTILGPRARIGDGARLENCTLWDQVQVGRHVRLMNCVIGHQAHVTESLSMYEGSVIQAVSRV